MIKIDVLFGEDICESLREGSLEQFAKDFNENEYPDFLEQEREFNTEEEKQAYIKGLRDAMCWGDCEIINKETSEKLNKLIKVE